MQAAVSKRNVMAGRASQCAGVASRETRAGWGSVVCMVLRPTEDRKAELSQRLTERREVEIDTGEHGTRINKLEMEYR